MAGMRPQAPASARKRKRPQAPASARKRKRPQAPASGRWAAALALRNFRDVKSRRDPWDPNYGVSPHV